MVYRIERFWKIKKGCKSCFFALKRTQDWMSEFSDSMSGWVFWPETILTGKEYITCSKEKVEPLVNNFFKYFWQTWKQWYRYIILKGMLIFLLIYRDNFCHFHSLRDNPFREWFIYYDGQRKVDVTANVLMCFRNCMLILSCPALFGGLQDLIIDRISLGSVGIIYMESGFLFSPR